MIGLTTGFVNCASLLLRFQRDVNGISALYRPWVTNYVRTAVHEDMHGSAFI
jgi:hypothetical protein